MCLRIIGGVNELSHSLVKDLIPSTTRLPHAWQSRIQLPEKAFRQSQGRYLDWSAQKWEVSVGYGWALTGSTSSHLFQFRPKGNHPPRLMMLWTQKERRTRYGRAPTTAKKGFGLQTQRVAIHQKFIEFTVCQTFYSIWLFSLRNSFNPHNSMRYFYVTYKQQKFKEVKLAQVRS